MKAFDPIPNSTKSVGASTDTASVAFDATMLPSGDFDVLVVNGGTTVAFVDFGSGSATSTSADTPVPGGAHRVLRVNNSPASPITHASAILASGTGTVYFTPGRGGL